MAFMMSPTGVLFISEFSQIWFLKHCFCRILIVVEDKLAQKEVSEMC